MSTKPARPESRPPTAQPATGTAVVGKAPRVPGAAPPPDPVMQQAKRDLDAGKIDTDLRATPGLDATRRAELVPGAGGKAAGKAK